MLREELNDFCKDFDANKALITKAFEDYTDQKIIVIFILENKIHFEDVMEKVKLPKTPI